MRALLISNSTQHGRGYLDHCADEIADFLGPLERLAFIPFAGSDWDGYTAQVAGRLAPLGIEVRGVHERTAPEVLEWAEAVFTGGGNTFRLLDELYERKLLGPLRDLVRAGPPYIGSSAGTNLACPTIKTTNDMPIAYPPSLHALALIPFQVNPHYLDPDPNSTHQGETREMRIREFHELNSPPVLGLREGAWLRREGDQLRLGGANAARLFRRGEEPEEFEPGADLSFLLE